MGEVATKRLQLGQRLLAFQPGEPQHRQTLHHLEEAPEERGYLQEPSIITVKVLASHLLALLDVIFPGVCGLQRREDVSVQGAVQSQILQAG